MFDAHCHLDFDAFDADRAAVLARARAVRVHALHVPGVAPDQWPRAAALCEGVDALGSGVGLHPWWIGRLDPDERDAALAGLPDAARQWRAEAIGECGLDAPLAKRGGPDLDVQTRVLETHLDAARALQLPVVLHILGAHGRALEILEGHGALPAGGMVHSYSGSAELVPRYVELGLYISFCGAVTRARARRTRAAARVVPADRLLLESDGPDQPLDGRDRGSPEDLALTAQAVAEVRGVRMEELGGQTEENARRLFARLA